MLPKSGECRLVGRSVQSSWQTFPRGRDGQLTVFYSLGCDQSIRDLFDQRCLALHQKHFETVVVIEVRMHR